jgi:hypothetical protein
MARDRQHTDLETLVRDELKGNKYQLRLWLRLLSCTNLITAEIRQRLRSEFEFTLPRAERSPLERIVQAHDGHQW